MSDKQYRASCSNCRREFALDELSTCSACWRCGLCDGCIDEPEHACKGPYNDE